MTYADIIVDISHEKLDKSFQYLVPQQLEEQIQVGMVVQIPFGRGNHVRKGYVVGLSGKLKVDGSCIKSIVSIENDQETIESRLIALAGWMKEHYGSTMIQALKTVLPIQKKVKAQEKRWITLSISREEGEKLLEELKKTRFKARIRLLEALLGETCNKPSASLNPNIRFIFWTAWPAAPFTRLSIAPIMMILCVLGSILKFTST